MDKERARQTKILSILLLLFTLTVGAIYFMGMSYFNRINRDDIRVLLVKHCANNPVCIKEGFNNCYGGYLAFMKARNFEACLNQ